ncbi:hypothetical protein ACEQ8H_005797 [Pleosporales sp. CAS-2024a]
MCENSGRSMSSFLKAFIHASRISLEVFMSVPIIMEVNDSSALAPPIDMEELDGLREFGSIAMNEESDVNSADNVGTGIMDYTELQQATPTSARGPSNIARHFGFQDGPVLTSFVHQAWPCLFVGCVECPLNLGSKPVLSAQWSGKPICLSSLLFEWSGLCPYTEDGKHTRH